MASVMTTTNHRERKRSARDYGIKRVILLKTHTDRLEIPDNAAGDILSNLMMIERKSEYSGGGGAAGAGSGGKIFENFGAKEMGITAAIAAALYLINGEYAQLFCTAFTSVPPAIFSYRVLMNQLTSREGYHSILFYWTIYGIFALIDQFAGSTPGYNLCKSGLLGTVFFHAAKTNPQVWKTMNKLTSGVVTSVLTRYDSNGFMKKSESSNFEPHSPTMTEFSDESEYMPTDGVFDETEQVDEAELEMVDVSTACSFLPSLEMQTTQKMSENAQKVGKQFESMSAMTVINNAAADITIIPSDKIQFSKYCKEAVVRITNICSLHIMFALKTNADTYLIAAPTTGMLGSGQSMTIRIGVTESYFESNGNPGKNIDKLAIDYTTIPMSNMIRQYSAAYFNTHARKRLALRVFYQ